MKKVAFAVFAALGLLALPAMAQDSYFYVGAGVGQGSVNTNSIEVITGQRYKFDANDTAFKIFGGWNYNKYIGVQLDYFDLGNASDKKTFDFDGEPVPVNTEIGVSGWVPWVVGTLPIGIFELSAKVGYAFYDIDGKVSALGEHDNFKDSDQDFAWGVGAGMTFFEHLATKLEYETIEVSGAQVDALWLTGAWRF
jgi:OOP family OmpA-OmpF porin